MTILSGAREAQLLEAVNQLLDARRTDQPLADLPSELQPASLQEVAYIQDTLVHSFGEVGGWKIGAANPEATPSFAPMPAAWIIPSGAILRGPTNRYRGVESEVAFLLANDIPPRTHPYTLEEILPYIASCHPVIEILESAFADPDKTSNLARQADLVMHGGLVYGLSCPEWKTIDFARESVVLAMDGSVRVERTGSNPAGNLLRLLPYLANEGAARTSGLRAGQWITTGSWTGNTQALASVAIDVHFSTLGRVTTRFE